MGSKIASIKNGSIKSFYTTKNKFNEISELIKNKSGIYFLMNTLNIYSKNFSIYIGQSNNLDERVVASHKNTKHNKILWEYALIFTNESNPLNTDEILCLERETYNLLDKNHYKILNGSIPRGTKNLKHNDISQLNIDSLNDIKILSCSLGFPIFYISKQNHKKIKIDKSNDYNKNRTQNNNENNTKDLFYLNGRQAKGLGYETDKSFIILKGSVISPLNPTSYYKIPKINGKRMTISSMINNNILNKNRILKRNIYLKSKTAAADLLIQSHVNGQSKWKQYKNRRN